jgi:hypothetical protein
MLAERLSVTSELQDRKENNFFSVLSLKRCNTAGNDLMQPLLAIFKQRLSQFMYVRLKTSCGTSPYLAIASHAGREGG